MEYPDEFSTPKEKAEFTYEMLQKRKKTKTYLLRKADNDARKVLIDGVHRRKK